MDATDRRRLVLVLAPTGRDTHLAAQALASAGIRTQACHDVAELLAGLEAGAGAAILTEEALRPHAAEAILRVLARQPPWSDFPLVLLGDPESGPRRDMRFVEEANVTLLERPLRTRTLVAAVVAALRGRERQYEAQRAIEERDMFLAMLGHELRNPLTAIRFALMSSDADAARARSVIERQSDRLGRLVDDLLDVSRVTSGKVHLRTRPVELRSLVEATVEAMAPAARDAGLTITVQASDAHLGVEADAVRLEQVFTNLLSNATKFTPAGGRIDVRLDRLGPHAVVTVRDTGVGIPKEGLRRIFQLFAQLETSLDRSRGGLGIGLTVAKALVELHGGTIGAFSAGPGHGTEVRVTLPLVESPPAPAVAPATVGHLARRLVIVEDNDDLREGFRAFLEDEGHEVHEARDGREGVEAILARRPDLAFVDLGLPLLDGYQVAREVRTRLGAGVRLVAVSGYGQAEDKVRARMAGFDLHLTKPVEPATLRSLLTEQVTSS